MEVWHIYCSSPLILLIQEYKLCINTWKCSVSHLSVYHYELHAEGASPHAVRLQVSRLEHHGGIHHWLFIFHVDPHLHGLQICVDPRVPETGQWLESEKKMLNFSFEQTNLVHLCLAVHRGWQCVWDQRGPYLTSTPTASAWLLCHRKNTHLNAWKAQL